MEQQGSLSWWEYGGTRRAVAISFLIALLVTFVLFFEGASQTYDKSSVLRNFIALVAFISGLGVGVLELVHSDEANKHRKTLNEIAARAEGHSQEANRLNTEANALRRETFELQGRIHQLQENIEEKMSKVRLYVNVREVGTGLRLLVSNLSGFDLWISQIEVVVTKNAYRASEQRVIPGSEDTLVARSQTRIDYLLDGTLAAANDNRSDRFNMQFYVRVKATGVADEPVFVDSPPYEFKFTPNIGRELKKL